MSFKSSNFIGARRSRYRLVGYPRVAQILCGCALPFVHTPDAAAATLNVCASGCSFTTIQAAVDHAKTGDTVEIGAGTYFENVKIPGRRLTLQGVGRRRAIIDGSLRGPVFTIGDAQSFNTGDTITFSEVTIMRGQSDHGGAIQVLNSSPLVLQHSIVLSNRSTGDGGGIWTPLAVAPLTIADCNFINNQAAFSGGAIEMTSEQPAFIISDSVFSHNVATGGSGGAVDTSGAHVSSGTITNSSFVQNQANIGGALNLTNLYSSQLQLTDVTVNGNSADLVGGGVLFSGSLVLLRSTIAHNVAGTDGGGIAGLGRFRGASSLSLVDTETIWNTAGDHGGGIFIDSVILKLSDSEVAHNTQDNCFDSGTGGPCR